MVMTPLEDVSYFLTLYSPGHTQEPRTDVQTHMFIDDLIDLLNRYEHTELLTYLRELREHKEWAPNG